MHGRIALNFVRESESALKAVSSAIADVKQAIPGARLIEATPDLVGLTDIADIVGCSRQNMRKMFLSYKTAFRAPIHEGSAAIWHLSKVLHGSYSIDDALIEVSSTNMQVNLARQIRDVDPVIQSDLRAII